MTFDNPIMHEVTAAVQQRRGKVLANGEIQFLCPAHADSDPSACWNPNKGTWFCHACGAKGGWKGLAQRLGIHVAQRGSDRGIVAEYDYLDAGGKLLFQVCRAAGKRFFQRRPDGLGRWVNGLGGVVPVLYRLPELLQAVQAGETIFIPEGEKDCKNLVALGLTATTNPLGAGKWRDSYAGSLGGANVVILPDNDGPGRKHAAQVAQSLAGRAASVKVLELPSLPDKGDVSDWLKNGGTKGELLRLAAAAPEWTLGAAGQWPEPDTLQETLLPVHKLPSDIIPEPFRARVVDIAYRMQCPVDFVAVATMVMAGGIIGTGCGIKPKRKDDWFVVPSLWGGVIAPPASLKTPALQDALKPLLQLEYVANQKYEAGQQVYLADKEAAKARREALKAEMLKVAKGKGVSLMETIKDQYAALQEPEKPVWRRYRTSDTTIEKMAELLSENPRGILLFRDELVGLLTSWDKEGRESDRAFYLEAWSGTSSVTTDRIGRGTIHVENLCVSILGGIQPAKLLAYLYQASSALENDGLIQRFQLLVYPDEPQGWQLVDVYPDVGARERTFRVIERLANIDFTEHGATLDEGDKIPHLHFDDSAQDLFYTWLTELEGKLRADDAPVMLEHLGKYRSLMPALALIDHLIGVADGTASGSVSLASARRAAAWCDYLESHARRVYGLIGDISQRAARELSKQIKAGKLQDGFTVRDVYTHGWHLLTTKELASVACDELVEASWLRRVMVPIEGRHPKVAYIINPRIFVF